MKRKKNVTLHPDVVAGIEALVAAGHATSFSNACEQAATAWVARMNALDEEDGPEPSFHGFPGDPPGAPDDADEHWLCGAFFGHLSTWRCELPYGHDGPHQLHGEEDDR